MTESKAASNPATPSLTTREQRAAQIATSTKLQQKGALWIVPSQAHAGSYIVEETTGGVTCTCPDFEERRAPCKHVLAVDIVKRVRAMVEAGAAPPAAETPALVKRPTYKQNWPAYNKAQSYEKELFTTLLRDLCNGIVAPKQLKGRPRHALADVVFSAAMKVYSTVSGRRASGDIRACEATGHIDKTPHYNTLFRYLEDDTLTPLLKNLVEVSARPLRAVEHDFAVDSSGIATRIYHRWYDAKYGRERREHTWLKVHVMTGVKTNVVTSVEVTDADVHDSPMFPGLVKTTAEHFKIAEVSGDKGYLSRKNMQVVVDAGAEPYLMFKANNGRAIGHAVWDKMAHYYAFNREAFLAHYHKRSNVETTFHMIKSKFGPAVRSKKWEAQVNEVLLKVLCHNVVVLVHSIYELGLQPVFWKDAASRATAH